MNLKKLVLSGFLFGTTISNVFAQSIPLSQHREIPEFYQNYREKVRIIQVGKIISDGKHYFREFNYHIDLDGKIDVSELYLIMANGELTEEPFFYRFDIDKNGIFSEEEVLIDPKINGLKFDEDEIWLDDYLRDLEKDKEEKEKSVEKLEI